MTKTAFHFCCEDSRDKAWEKLVKRFTDVMMYKRGTRCIEIVATLEAREKIKNYIIRYLSLILESIFYLD